MPFSDLELESAREILWSDIDQSSEEFAEALATLVSAVEEGDLQYAGLVAEIFALPGPRHNAALAYKFYYVSHSEDGYMCKWANESKDPQHYLGPVGDFRNEAMVNDMMLELGLSAIPALEAEAAKLVARGV